MWNNERESVFSQLGAYEEKFVQSYGAVAVMHAWNEFIISRNLSSSAEAFFLEAQNDALTSHVMARMGSWRAALKFLRSCIENVLFAAYYKDHLVELRLWEAGTHRLTFAELHNYFEKHPDLSGVPPTYTGLEEIKKEYSTLSVAVHASAEPFRMTRTDDGTRLFLPDRARLGAWKTREQRVLRSLSLFLIGLFKQYLTGTAFPALRSALARLINTESYRKAISVHYGVAIPKTAR